MNPTDMSNSQGSRSLLEVTICPRVLSFTQPEPDLSTILPSRLGSVLKRAAWHGAEELDGSRSVIELDRKKVLAYISATSSSGSIGELTEQLDQMADQKDACEMVLSYYIGCFRRSVEEKQRARSENKIHILQLCGLLSAFDMERQGVSYARFETAKRSCTISIYTDPSRETTTTDITFNGDEPDLEQCSLMFRDSRELSRQVAEAKEDYLEMLKETKPTVIQKAAEEGVHLEITIEEDS